MTGFSLVGMGAPLGGAQAGLDFQWALLESWNVSRRLTRRSLPFIRSQTGEKWMKRAIIDA